MIRHPILCLSLALPAAAISLCLGALSAFAQSGSYVPPQQNTPSPYGDTGPRSIRPPQYSGSNSGPGYGAPYTAPPQAGAVGPAPDGSAPPPPPDTYSNGEIVEAGHRFFGNVSEGLAKVIF